MVINKGGAPHSLTEIPAASEFELQELVKERPEILPFEEYDIVGPLMVVGRETTLPSGSVDLVGLARSGDILIIEFKTGPQNTDFRAALSQLLDYGSDLWGMSYDEFESTVALRYFGSNHCRDENVLGKNSLVDAQIGVWQDMNTEDRTLFRERLSRHLESGMFHYLLVASRFTKAAERTINYMNHISTTARFYAVELVSFTGDDITAYETRTLVKPENRSIKKSLTSVSETQLLNAIADEKYRDNIRELFEICRALRLNFEWGAVGVSIRLITSDSSEPISIGWIFPPGKSGWMGLSGITLGYDTASAERVPSVIFFLKEYVAAVGNIDGVQVAKPKNLHAYYLSQVSIESNLRQISEIIAELVKKSSET